jgi:hypothetical protein
MNSEDLRLVDEEVLRERVRRQIERCQKQDGRVGRFLQLEVVKLCVGFLLTGVLGLAITHCYQTSDEAARVTAELNAETSKRLAEARETRRVLQLVALDSTSAIINRTYYAFTRYYDGVRTGPKWPADTVEQRRRQMRALRDVYYSRRMSLAAKTCALFGAETHRSYLAMDASLEAASAQLSGFGKGLRRLEATWSALQDFQGKSYNLFVRMARIASDTTGLGTSLCVELPRQAPPAGLGPGAHMGTATRP